MNNQRVAVEESLKNVSDYLQSQGCQVVSLSDKDGCNCCVITGGDKDMMGMQDTASDMAVINAEGMTPEEVYQMVQSRLNLS
ncbi:YkuS family protein [Salinithrix halophila]|uniref:YkuS family protein n=1 Tax=Salinithrix halophila TaxID=1485204 RepID=A0ABV8JFM0_9BACL